MGCGSLPIEKGTWHFRLGLYSVTAWIYICVVFSCEKLDKDIYALYNIS